MAAAALIVHFWMVLITLVLAQDGTNQFIYNGFHGAKLHLSGNATLHSNGLLQLTNISERQRGYTFFPFPIKFNTSSSSNQPLSFSTCFVFAIVPQLLNFSGHGMTFVISPSMDFSRATATAYLGLFNSSNDGLPTNHVLAVELDTVESPEFKDIDESHVGIDVNSMISNDSAPATYFSDEEGQNKSLLLISGKPIQIWIDYNGAEKLLNVTIAPISVTKPSRPLLSKVIDLSQILQESMYVGFTAATGAVRSYHYVLGWSFNRSGKAENLNVSKLPSLPPPPSPWKTSGKQWIPAVIAVGGLAATIVIGIILVILFLFFMRRRRARFEAKFLFELMNEAKEIEIEGKKGFKLKVYSVSSIMDATNCFSEENKLGEGGYGPVYKGLLDGQEIAIKKLSRSSRQGLAEFKNELIIVAKLQHTNLVQLLGLCIQGEEKMLVYEFMPHNSLDSYIFDQSKRKLFNWNKYFNIIEEIAQGILYLHKYSRLRIIHRDLKAGNILLDNNMNPKISDFGMARIFTTTQSEANTNRIAGTRGYMAPEYAVMGIFSTKSDVFSYGVLVLEIVSGRRSNSNFNFDRPLNLIGYAWMLWKEDAALELMHPTLRDSCSEDRVLRCINVALLCVEDNPLDRPSMADVISMLTSEGVELPMPKQPAFCIERRVAEVNSSTGGMAENRTINNLTMSVMTGR